MFKPYNKKLKPFSRKLRKNMTDAEKLLWMKVRRKQLKSRQFYRQKTLGNYIVDFYCPASNLVIELDGRQHFSLEGRTADKKRDDFLRELGITVLRYSNREVLQNLKDVLQDIYQHL